MFRLIRGMFNINILKYSYQELFLQLTHPVELLELFILHVNDFILCISRLTVRDSDSVSMIKSRVGSRLYKPSAHIHLYYHGQETHV